MQRQCVYPIVSHNLWPHTMYLENTWESRAFLWFWNYSRNSALELAVAVHGPQPGSIMRRCHVLDEGSRVRPSHHPMASTSVVFLSSPRTERSVSFDTPPLLHMPSSLSPRRGGRISTHFCSKYSWGHGPAGPLLLHSWHLPDLKSSWRHLFRGHPPLDTKETTPSLLLTSVLNFCSCPLTKLHVPSTKSAILHLNKISQVRSVPHL